MERRREPARTFRLETVKANIADRLRTVCGHLSPDEFDKLVEQMAVVEIKYNVRRTHVLFPAVIASEEEQPT